MIVVRLQFPVRSPYPLIVPCTCIAPPSTPAIALATPVPRVVVEVDRDTDVAPKYSTTSPHDPLDVVRQRAAVGVAQHEPARARLHRAFEHPQAELGVALVAVEEVLGVEQHVAGPRRCRNSTESRDHRHALVERRAERFGDVVVPRLADDAHGADVRLDEVAQRVVAVDLALRPAASTRTRRACSSSSRSSAGARRNSSSSLGLAPGQPASM